MKEIVILVDPEGNTSVEAFGYTGQGCLDATAAFEKVLGQIKERKLKPEAHVHVAEKTGQKVKQ